MRSRFVSWLGGGVFQIVEKDFHLASACADGEKTEAVEHGVIRFLAGPQVGTPQFAAEYEEDEG